jgi:four helix bundle protein
MPEIRRFEDLEAWKLARELTNRIYSLTREGAVVRDFGFIDQIRRAAVSVMSNIAEGFDRGSNKDFVKFLFIARGSAAEVRSLLYVALDQGYVTDTQFAECRDVCIRSGQIIWGLIRSLRNKSGLVMGVKIFVLGTALLLGLSKI